ncbi:MAG: hypothetical protein QOE93_1413 [Actinomycetota bacterium]|jgi:hypothetical protein|nr:hypothetical protein [Actinomycetota bacterium]
MPHVQHGPAVGISSFRRFVVSEFPDESLRDEAGRTGSSSRSTATWKQFTEAAHQDRTGVARRG